MVLLYSLSWVGRLNASVCLSVCLPACLKPEQLSTMPETIGIGPVLSNSNSTTTPLRDLDLRFGGVTFEGGEIRSDVHAILPTKGTFGLAPDPPAAALPKYSLEKEVADRAPRDHAASVAAEIAQKLAEGSAAAVDGQQPPPSSFRAAALKSVTDHVEIRERRAAAKGVGTGRAAAPAGIDATRVPNLWLAVAHSSAVKAGAVKKVEVDGVPISLWRTATGEVSAVSDVCIHRGASLARGWIANDRLVCPCEMLRLHIHCYSVSCVVGSRFRFGLGVVGERLIGLPTPTRQGKSSGACLAESQAAAPPAGVFFRNSNFKFEV